MNPRRITSWLQQRSGNATEALPNTTEDRTERSPAQTSEPHKVLSNSAAKDTALTEGIG
ncbi:hypothetical protein [Sodalinema gerasimenkoae]|uniref:hypothetical protein n=1 Tax=Sodalinema gerasimenkoae TaxID=2862348 RepID=UPI001CA4E849|nr:hypothetical protein [Sodalinema gerasimenkoae]